MAQTSLVLVRWALTAMRLIACFVPVLGLGVFWWLPFKPAVTLYVLITGLAFVFLKWIELAKLSFDLDQMIVQKAVKQRGNG